MHIHEVTYKFQIDISSKVTKWPPLPTSGENFYTLPLMSLTSQASLRCLLYRYCVTYGKQFSQQLTVFNVACNKLNPNMSTSNYETRKRNLSFWIVLAVGSSEKKHRYSWRQQYCLFRRKGKPCSILESMSLKPTYLWWYEFHDKLIQRNRILGKVSKNAAFKRIYDFEPYNYENYPVLTSNQVDCFSPIKSRSAGLFLAACTAHAHLLKPLAPQFRNWIIPTEESIKSSIQSF